MSGEMARVFAIAWKDLVAETRSKANFNAVAFFATLILLMFGMALGPDRETAQKVAPGILWLAILLSGVLSFNRSYERELEAGALDALLLYPGDRRSIFVGKLIANLMFVILVEIIIVPVAAILFQIHLVGHLLPLIGIILLGTIGFVTLGTFYAAMSSQMRAREVLLPLLLFPMLIPVLVAAVKGTDALLLGSLMGEPASWSKLLFAFDVIFLVATFMAFEHVIEA